MLLDERKLRYFAHFSLFFNAGEMLTEDIFYKFLPLKTPRISVLKGVISFVSSDNTGAR